MKLRHLAAGALAALTLVGLAGGINGYVQHAGAQQAPVAASAGCLNYNQPATLSGTLVRLGTSSIVALQLPMAICTNPETVTGITDPGESGVKLLQVAYDGGASWPGGVKYVGRHLTISGKLWHSYNIHHHTAVLLDLEKYSVQP